MLIYVLDLFDGGAEANLTLVKNLGSGFKCYSNMHKLVSRPMVLCLNISIFQGPVDKMDPKLVRR